MISWLYTYKLPRYFGSLAESVAPFAKPSCRVRCRRLRPCHSRFSFSTLNTVRSLLLHVSSPFYFGNIICFPKFFPHNPIVDFVLVATCRQASHPNTQNDREISIGYRLRSILRILLFTKLDFLFIVPIRVPRPWWSPATITCWTCYWTDWRLSRPTRPKTWKKYGE